MRIVVVGAGAMGGVFGTRLATAGNDVLLYDTWSEHVRAIEDGGIRIQGLDGTSVRYRVRATDTPPPAIGAADLILVQVKGPDTYDALFPFAGRIKPDAFVLSLQNGLGNLEQMRAALPGHERILIGTTAHGAYILGPGRIRHAGRGLTVIGDPTVPQTPRFPINAIRNVLVSAGFDTQIAKNIHSAVWAKLVSNVAINPISALTGLRNGQLLDDPDLVAVVEQVVRETVAVMRAAAVPPATDDFLAHAKKVMKDTDENISSMLQDIRRGRRTEIDAINGAVARLGDELGVATPVNQLLTILVRNRERVAMREAQANGNGTGTS